MCRQLRGLGAHVTGAARRAEDLAWLSIWGCRAVSSRPLPADLDRFDLVINTVPALLLGRAQLASLKPECLVIDLASSPGGVDLPAARELGRRVIPAPALPGRVAPVTAALAIRDTLYHILTELGV